MNQAIRPPPVAQRCLHCIAVFGQSLGNDIVQLNFTKRAACLFVAQNILQAQHITRQFGDEDEDEAETEAETEAEGEAEDEAEAEGESEEKKDDEV